MTKQSRKVLLTLNDHTSNTATLDLVAEFAAAIHAEIDGLFFEDKTLFDIAALPFTREISRHSLRPGELEVSTLEHQMRMLSNAAQRELHSCAQRWKVQCSFTTTGRDIHQWLGSKEHTHSTLCVAHKEAGDWERWRRSDKENNKPAIEKLLEKHPGPLMLLPKKQGSGRELIGIVHDQRSIERVLKPIESLVKKGHHPVIILLCEDPPEIEKLKSQLLQELTERGLQASILYLQSPTQESLFQVMNQHSPKLMILESSNPVIGHGSLNELVELTGAPLLLLREPEAG